MGLKRNGLFVFCLALIISCSGGGGGGDGTDGDVKTVPAVHDATGTWTFTTTPDNSSIDTNTTCSPREEQGETIVITQSGDSFTMVNEEGRTMSGSVDGTSYLLSGSWQESGETIQVSGSFTMSSETDIAGKIKVKGTEGSEYCNWDMAITGVKADAMTFSLTSLTGTDIISESAGIETTITQLNAFGTWNPDADDYILEGKATIVNQSNGTVVSAFDLNITEPFRYHDNDDEAFAGKMTVKLKGGGTIQVAVNTTSGKDVDLSLDMDDDGTVDDLESYSWSELSALLTVQNPSPSDAWKTLGASAYYLRKFLLIGVLINRNDLMFLASGNATLDAGPLKVDCDVYPADGSRGQRTYTWTDTNGSGVLDNGDTVAAAYAKCWLDDPGADMDLLIDGTETYEKLVMVKSPYEIGADIRSSDTVLTPTLRQGGVYTSLTSMAMKNNGGIHFEMEE